MDTALPCILKFMVFNNHDRRLWSLWAKVSAVGNV
ncbi:hypothetical protein LMG27174_01484 [Paraburkholderia rhynchosiae]|uniref:Uncharacterized protein n=1 Tax=Paraburkholderia rhynchosiae TaxID=487049 RepID=A0A6J5AR25_9BURK|nr:hypothetical protein LMG27174_01484 [Paraburkholderia rhynchosiae]